jgi:formylglycine-generating enzyme required for sulfatase activity/tRNA A-37 threonylcarbamoyl transferase component Bud32
MAETRKIGNFELVERIGQGGMGAVFKARQISMDRIVALKVLPPRLAKQGTFIERFMREAHAVARLNHPNIVRGIDVGEDAGVYYLAMEFVDGASAKKLLRPGGLPEEQVLKIGKAIAGALAHAHQQGILHRDIKPDNILMDQDGTPKLCDLGLARLDNQSEEDHSLTQAGSAMGTPLYISPEQARGDADLDAKTDLYSLGATLYHLLCGKPLFEGATSAVVMLKHLTAKCPNPADDGIQVSRGFLMILGKLLAKERAERYESAQVLAEDLERVIHGNLPLHASVPAAKWPFASALPAAPVRRAVGASAPGAGAGADRPRVGQAQSLGSGMTWLAIGGVAALLVIVAAVLINGSRSKPAEGGTPAAGPAPAAPAAAPAAAAANEQLAQMLLFAQDYAKRDPDNYHGIIAEFEKVRIAAAGTEIEGTAKQAIADAIKRRAEATDAAAKLVADQAAALEAQGRYDSALQLWQQAPAKSPLITAEIIAKAAADLCERAEARLQALLDAGQQSLASSRWDDGRKAVAAARGLEYSAGQGRIEDLSGRLATAERAAADASRSAAAEQAQGAFAKHLERFIDATLKLDLRGARAVAAEAQADPGMQALADRVQDLGDLCAVLQKIESSRQAALQALKDGKEHEFEKANLEKISGVVTSISPNEISLLIPVPGGDSSSSAAMPVRIADLSAKQRGRLAGTFKPQTPADFLALGINAFAQGDVATCKSDLETAKDHPLAAAYQARLDTRLMGAVEAAAKAAWLALERQAAGGIVTEAAALDLDKRLKAFLAEHGQTKYVASIADQIAALRRSIDGHLGNLSLDLGNGVHLDAVLIHEGSFLMGSPPGEQDRRPEELQHKVTLTHPFFIGKFLVTQEQYQQVMGDTPSTFKQQPQCPVDRVSWFMAQQFCDQASRLSGKTVRLPTEAEWEYACRAGTTTAFYFGDDDAQMADYAWYRDDTTEVAGAAANGQLKFRVANAVGTKKPNAWGLFDMCGNVPEWCQDWLGAYGGDEAVDPAGPDGGQRRIIRGGSEYVASKECRSACRNGYPPERVSSHLGGFGFRIVVEKR